MLVLVGVDVRVGVGVGVAVNMGGVTWHGTILTYPLRIPLRSMPVATPPLATSTCKVCIPGPGVKPRMVAGVVNPIVAGDVVSGLLSRETVAVSSARICRSGEKASGPHCSQQSWYE